MKGLAILLVDDEPLMRLSMVDALEAVGYDVHAAASGTEGLQVLRQKAFDLVITDLRLPGADGLTILKATKDKSPETEVVMITAHGSVESAVGAMKLGAFDYITKPFQMDELLLIVERVGRVIALRRENRDLKETLESKFCFNGILGTNSQMRAVLDKIKTVASTDSTILILGAFDYITKPFQMDELLLIVERVGRVIALRRENRDLKETLESKFCFNGILGTNSQMRAVLDKIKTVASTDSTILILGESGTGKELVANAIHQNSARSQHPLIKVSCAALPETLLEAELFGHEKGAFTGALRQRRGRFELAHRGTLFLDEIGEISPVVQVKLLRVLQERKFERVGGNETIDVDVRLVCATQKDLKKEVSQGKFREDLFYRLNVVQVVIPPLRKRQEDTMVIADHVLQTCSIKMNKKLKGFSPPSRELLLRYSFPGNVRELENMVERAVALGREGEAVQPQDLCGFQSCPFTGGVAQEACGFCSEGLTGQKRQERPLNSLAGAREEFEKDYILSVLERVEGSRTTASKILGLSRKALWEKCKRYGIPSAKGETEPEEE